MTNQGINEFADPQIFGFGRTPGPIGRLPRVVGAQPLKVQPPKGEVPISVKVDVADCTITFDPGKSRRVQHATQINFHQVMQIWVWIKDATQPTIVLPGQFQTSWRNANAWTTPKKWFLDSYELTEPPYYLHYQKSDVGEKGRKDGQTTSEAWMLDYPGFSEGHDTELMLTFLYHKIHNPKGKYGKVKFLFRTFAACEQGGDKDSPHWYEGITWNWTLSAKHYYESGRADAWRGKSHFGNVHHQTPQQDVLDAVAAYKREKDKAGK